jgi:prophage DNA circulation protein
MEHPDVKASVPICNAVFKQLLVLAPTRGRPGSDLRTAVGDFLANVETFLRADIWGPPIDNIFELARLTGVTVYQLEDVRKTAVALTPTLLGAVLVQNSIIEFILATESRIIADMAFVSREDVDKIHQLMNDAFWPMQELAADDMDQATFQALIALHASLAFFLAESARPLPRMLDYGFYDTLPTLTIAYKLYSDAGRADEVRAENKIVHPAFSPMAGRGLSN